MNILYIHSILSLIMNIVILFSFNDIVNYISPILDILTAIPALGVTCRDIRSKLFEYLPYHQLMNIMQAIHDDDIYSRIKKTNCKIACILYKSLEYNHSELFIELIKNRTCQNIWFAYYISRINLRDDCAEIFLAEYRKKSKNVSVLFLDTQYSVILDAANKRNENPLMAFINLIGR